MIPIENRERFLSRGLLHYARRKSGKTYIPETPTVNLVRSIKDSDVTDVVSQSVVGIALGREDMGAISIITRNIDWKKAQEYTPQWINLAGLVKVIREVSTVGNLQRQLESSPDLEQAAVLSFLKKPSLDQGIAKLKEANDRVAGTAITNALLGALLGRDVQKVLDRNEIASTLKDKIIHRRTIAYAVALEIGDRFGTPARSPEELLERLQNLLPNSDDPFSGSESTLQDLFIKHRTFDTHISGVTVRCPAIHTTGVMLGEWGRQLATNNVYKKRFIDSIRK